MRVHLARLRRAPAEVGGLRESRLRPIHAGHLRLARESGESRAGLVFEYQPGLADTSIVPLYLAGFAALASILAWVPPSGARD
jgi:hypothetical protein